MQIFQLEVGMFQANCYAVVDKQSRKALVVDPGDEPAKIVAWLDRLKAKPEAIFITHGHFDHIGAAAPLAELWQVPIYTSLDELVYMEDRSHPLLAMTAEVVDGFLAAAPQYVQGLCHGDMIQLAGKNWQIIEVPGHSDHGLCLYGEAEGVLFSGDTLFAGSVGRTDLFNGSPYTLVSEIKSKLMGLPDGVSVYPGHGPKTTIGQERRQNPFLNGYGG